MAKSKLQLAFKMTSDWNDFCLAGERATQVVSGQKISSNGLNLAEIEAFEDASDRSDAVVDFGTGEDPLVRAACHAALALGNRLNKGSRKGQVKAAASGRRRPRRPLVDRRRPSP